LKNELTPQYFFLENVPMDTRSQNIISDFLECEPIVINSKLVSAQDRERLYWTNLPFSKPNNSNILLCDIVGFNSDIPYNLDEIRGEISKLTKREFGFSISKSGRIRPYRFDVSKSGISEVGTIVNPYDKSTTLIKSQVPKTYHSNPFRIHELTRNECEMLQNVPIGYTDAVSENKAKEMLGNGWTVGIIKQFFMNLNSSPISRQGSMSLFAIG
jgi:site-specific DNA-cytosine methylase